MDFLESESLIINHWPKSNVRELKNRHNWTYIMDCKEKTVLYSFESCVKTVYWPLRTVITQRGVLHYFREYLTPRLTVHSFYLTDWDWNSLKSLLSVSLFILTWLNDTQTSLIVHLFLIQKDLWRFSNHFDLKSNILPFITFTPTFRFVLYRAVVEWVFVTEAEYLCLFVTCQYSFPRFTGLNMKSSL